MSDAKYLILASGLLSGIYDVKRFVYVRMCISVCVYMHNSLCLSICSSVCLSICISA